MTTFFSKINPSYNRDFRVDITRRLSVRRLAEGIEQQQDDADGDHSTQNNGVSSLTEVHALYETIDERVFV